MRRLLSRLIKLVRPGQTSFETHRLPQYNVYEARSIFSHLLRRASRGEEIVIARAGVPIVKLVPYSHELTQPGILRAQMMLNLRDEQFADR
jgi:prevent-host-death family protein